MEVTPTPSMLNILTLKPSLKEFSSSASCWLVSYSDSFLSSPSTDNFLVLKFIGTLSEPDETLTVADRPWRPLPLFDADAVRLFPE